MKLKFAILFFVYLFVANVRVANSQVSSTATNIGIDAKVIAPITISNTGSTNLDFGTISTSSVAGSVTVPPEGARVASGGVSVLSSSSFSSAPFEVTGNPDATCQLSLPGDLDVKLTRTGGAEQMTVTGFNIGGSTTITLDNNGDADFKVGATLNLGVSQIPGEYTGSFSVTIAYQ